MSYLYCMDFFRAYSLLHYVLFCKQHGEITVTVEVLICQSVRMEMEMI